VTISQGFLDFDDLDVLKSTDEEHYRMFLHVSLIETTGFGEKTTEMKYCSQNHMSRVSTIHLTHPIMSPFTTWPR
jgi:hypothetical protein